MPDQVGVGIIGTGTIAQHHLRSLTRGGPGKPVAVFDVLTDRAEATARHPTDSEDALEVTRVIDAAYCSVRESRVMSLA